MSETLLVRDIFIYPVKSLDGIRVAEAEILASGALRHDREFMLCDDRGEPVNGKRFPQLHGVRASYDLQNTAITLRPEDGTNGPQTFALENSAAIERWFRDFLGSVVHLRRNTLVGFPDDLESPGPTIVGSASLREIASWFGWSEELEVVRRFRPNIVIRTSAAFWEDCLFGLEGDAAVFQLGAVTVHGINPCQRCAVPSRHPNSGEVTPNFQRVFAEHRAQQLPVWSESSRFNHYYRFSVNTRIPSSEAGKQIRAGDEVRGPGPRLQ